MMALLSETGKRLFRLPRRLAARRSAFPAELSFDRVHGIHPGQEADLSCGCGMIDAIGREREVL